MPACVDELVVQSELVAKVAWGDEPAAAVGVSIEDLHRARCRQDLALLLAVRSLQCRAEHRVEGHANVASWIQHHLHVPKRTAVRIARLSRFLSQHPVLEDGMRAGCLSLDHLDVIERHYKLKHAKAWDQALPAIAAHAATMRFEDLARDLQAFANNLDPKDAEERFEELIEGRSCRKLGNADYDGFGLVKAWMDPISYRIFANEHDRLVDELFQQDWAFAKDALGRNPDAKELADLTRSPDQRSHDALVEMARRSRTLAGGAVAAAAEVVLHCDLATYEEADRHVTADDLGDEMVLPDDGFCETEDGTPVSPVAAVLAALQGRVRRIVFDADDEVVSYGRARRPYTPVQAAAVRAKYRRCCHPFGCDRTGRSLQTDHQWEWQDGGPTDVTNGKPMDGGHNRWKTNTRNQPPPPGPRDHGQRRGPPMWQRE